MSQVLMDIPEWVAPVGRQRDDIKLGDRVRFEAILEDGAGGNHWDGVGEPDDWCGWSRCENHIGQGIITGLRFVYSGRMVDDRRMRERTHRVYLVVLNMHHKPVHVLSDDVVLLEQ